MHHPGVRWKPCLPESLPAPHLPPYAPHRHVSDPPTQGILIEVDLNGSAAAPKPHRPHLPTPPLPTASLPPAATLPPTPYLLGLGYSSARVLR